MPKRKWTTRANNINLYSETPSDLQTTDLPTSGDIGSFFRKLEIEDASRSEQEVLKITEKKILEIWKKANPRIPLIEPSTVYIKLKRLYQNIKKFDYHRLTKKKGSNLVKDREKLFDICKCNCNLDIKECSDFTIKCQKQNCTEVHIFCSCPIKVGFCLQLMKNKAIGLHQVMYVWKW